MHELTENGESEDAMNRPLGTLGAVAAGALAMYYLDPELGAQRRAVLAELVRTGLPGSERRPQSRGRTVRRAYHRPVMSDPQSDAELRDRIQGRLGRLVSHPRAIQIQVDEGVVRLTGRVLAKERDGLLEQVQQMPGVQKLVNAMTAHDWPQEIASRRPVAVPIDVASR
jgi:hypothetical protein